MHLVKSFDFELSNLKPFPDANIIQAIFDFFIRHSKIIYSLLTARMNNKYINISVLNLRIVC